MDFGLWLANVEKSIHLMFDWIYHARKWEKRGEVTAINSLLLHTWDIAICMGLSNQNFIITESYNTIRVCLYNFSRVQFIDYSKDFVLLYLVVYLWYHSDLKLQVSYHFQILASEKLNENTTVILDTHDWEILTLQEESLKFPNKVKI